MRHTLRARLMLLLEVPNLGAGESRMEHRDSNRGEKHGEA
jgi:hypothetical protein